MARLAVSVALAAASGFFVATVVVYLIAGPV